MKQKSLIQMQCNKITKTSIIKKCRENEQYISGEDYLFNLDLLKECKKIKISTNCGYIYEDNIEGVSNHIKFNYTTHYELKNLLNMMKIESEKLKEIGFDENYIIEHNYKSSLNAIRRTLRNIALIKEKRNIKRKKYIEIIQNETLKNLLSKKIKNINKKDTITLIVYKMKSLIGLKIYANLLMYRTKIKEK